MIPLIFFIVWLPFLIKLVNAIGAGVEQTIHRSNDSPMQNDGSGTSRDLLASLVITIVVTLVVAVPSALVLDVFLE